MSVSPIRAELEKMPQVNQPEVQHYWSHGIYVRQMLLAKRGYTALQHAHHYDHLTFVAAGAVRVEVDGQITEYHAPSGINISASRKHSICALVDGTVCYCIHRLGADEDPESLVKER